VIFLFLCVSLLSCQQKTNTTKIKINYGALSEEDKFEHGMILYAKSLTNLQVGLSVFPGVNAHEDDLIRRLDNDSNLLELNNGKWLFFGIGYHTMNQQYCAYSALTLTGGQQEVTLEFSDQNCTGEKSKFLGDEQYRENWSMEGAMNPTNVLLCPEVEFINNCIEDSNLSITRKNSSLCLEACQAQATVSHRLVIAYYGRSIAGDNETMDEFNFYTSLHGEISVNYSNVFLIYGTTDINFNYLPVSLYLYQVDESGLFTFPDRETSLADSSVINRNMESVNNILGLEGFNSEEFQFKIKIISGKEVADNHGVTSHDDCDESIPCNINWLVYCIECKL